MSTKREGRLKVEMQNYLFVEANALLHSNRKMMFLEGRSRKRTQLLQSLKVKVEIEM